MPGRGECQTATAPRMSYRALSGDALMAHRQWVNARPARLRAVIARSAVSRRAIPAEPHAVRIFGARQFCPVPSSVRPRRTARTAGERHDQTPRPNEPQQPKTPTRLLRPARRPPDQPPGCNNQPLSTASWRTPWLQTFQYSAPIVSGTSLRFDSRGARCARARSRVHRIKNLQSFFG